MAKRFVHAVERAQERGFAAARGPDQSGDAIRGNVEAEAEYGLLRAVEEIQVGNLQAHRRLLDRSRMADGIRDPRFEREPRGRAANSLRG